MGVGRKRESPIWTTKRKWLFALLCIHWTCIAVYAIPFGGIRSRLLEISAPLPAINTHRGEDLLSVQNQSIVKWYLNLVRQDQRWRMFMPRIPNVTYLELEYDVADETSKHVRLSEVTQYWLPRRCRWQYLESALLNPAQRKNFLPRATQILFRRFVKEPASKVRAMKLGYPVPLLEPDGSGNAMFSSSSDWGAIVWDRSQYLTIDMGEFPTLDRPGHE